MPFVSLTDFTLLLVEPLTIIHDATNRGIVHRGDFYKVQPDLARFTQRFIFINNPYLIVRFINEPNYVGFYSSVYP